MNHPDVIKVLLVEDDEDDFILTRGLFRQIKGREFVLDWAKSFAEGLHWMCRNKHDICLVDYRLGADDGVGLLKAAIAGGCQAPVILLTGMGQREVDMAAMNAGATDYLVKAEVDASELERTIRYALERKRAAVAAAFEQARLAAFGSTVGLALTRDNPLNAILQECAEAMVQFQGAALAQIWAYDTERQTPEPRVSAGPICVAGIAPVDFPTAPPAVEELMRGGAVIVKSLLDDPRVADGERLAQRGLASFAGYPLMLENRLVGLLGIYTEHPLTDAVTQEFASVAHGIALCIQQKLSREALSKTEGQYRRVVESIREVIFQMNDFGYWTFLNPAWTAITGFTVDESLDTFFLNYIHHDDRPQNRHIFLQLIGRKIDYCRHETRFLTKDGEVRWMEIYIQLTHQPDGTTLGASGSLNDVTERKLAEVEIQKLAAFPRVNPNPVLEFAEDGSLSYLNDAAQQMVRSFGVEDVLALLPEGTGGIVRECLSTRANRLRQKVEKGGRTLSWSFFPVPASRVVHCYGADMTEVVTLEARFRHAQKLDSIGQLAAGVAHDFNNILTIIQGYSDLLLLQHHGNPAVAPHVKTISDASKRAAALTRQLLAFSRRQLIQPRVLDLNSVLRNLDTLLVRVLGEDIAMTREFADALPSIEADAGMLEQIVMNLAVNARDAMPKGGHLKVATGTVEISAFETGRHPDARAGSFVVLTVSDDGTGMDAQTLGRIFEPFFSTKEVGKGTGLGLATVYGIVRQHHGWIEVASTTGAGTTFNIFLPSVAKPAETLADTTFKRADINGDSESILLVEDEPELRVMVREILESYNYRVVEACSGVDALNVWDKHSGAFDLLLTDMVMPEGMNGQELAAQLRHRAPKLKIIYTSGYSAAMLATDPQQRDGWFLQKPYKPAALAELVRDCLDDSQKPAALAN